MFGRIASAELIDKKATYNCIVEGLNICFVFYQNFIRCEKWLNLPKYNACRTKLRQYEVKIYRYYISIVAKLAMILCAIKQNWKLKDIKYILTSHFEHETFWS